MSGIGGGGNKMSGPVTVGAPTVLWGPFNVQDVPELLFAVASLDHECKMLVQTSQDAVHWEDPNASGEGGSVEFPVPAGGANSRSIAPAKKRRWYQLVGYTPDLGVLTEASVMFDVVTLSRG